MANVTVKTTKKIILTLSEDEAAYLLAKLQNGLKDELEKDYLFRESIFKAIHKVMVAG